MTYIHPADPRRDHDVSLAVHHGEAAAEMHGAGLAHDKSACALCPPGSQVTDVRVTGRTYDSALALLCSDRGYLMGEATARRVLSDANAKLLHTSSRVRVRYSPETGLYRVTLVYSTSRNHCLEAVPVGMPGIEMPAAADYAVCQVERDGSDNGQPYRVWGYVVDGRADGFGFADPSLSDWSPAGEDDRPYDAFDLTTPGFLGDSHSLRGAVYRVAMAHYGRR